MNERRRCQGECYMTTNQGFLRGSGRVEFVKAGQVNHRIERGSNGVNWDARSVRSGRFSNVPRLPSEALNQICGKAGLVQVDGNGGGSDAP